MAKGSCPEDCTRHSGHQGTAPPQPGHPQGWAHGIKVRPSSLTLNPSCAAPAPRSILEGVTIDFSLLSLSPPCQVGEAKTLRAPNLNPARSDRKP